MIKFECTSNGTVFEADGVTEEVVAQSVKFVAQFSEWINKKEKDAEAQEAFKELFIILAEKIVSSGYQETVDLLMEMAKKEAENEQLENPELMEEMKC
ncbi:MAG TPA: hypothetical protein IAD10_08515 [Candidatus Fimicola cottocaccae]|nr:hypothetical protein [Candidatus Fimicola cottocaccae]